MRLIVALIVFAVLTSPTTLIGEIRTSEDTSASAKPPYSVSKVDLINQGTPSLQLQQESGYGSPAHAAFGPIGCLNDGLMGEDATSQNFSTAILDEDGVFSVTFHLNTSGEAGRIRHHQDSDFRGGTRTIARVKAIRCTSPKSGTIPSCLWDAFSCSSTIRVLASAG